MAQGGITMNFDKDINALSDEELSAISGGIHTVPDSVALFPGTASDIYEALRNPYNTVYVRYTNGSEVSPWVRIDPDNIVLPDIPGAGTYQLQYLVVSEAGKIIGTVNEN